MADSSKDRARELLGVAVGAEFPSGALRTGLTTDQVLAAANVTALLAIAEELAKCRRHLAKLSGIDVA